MDNKIEKVVNKVYLFQSIKMAIGFIIVGLLMLGISTFAFINYKEYDGVTNATISKIAKTDDRTAMEEEEDIGYTVYVDYEIDGKEFKNIELGSYSSDMKEGDKIEIRYDLNDPYQIKTPGGRLFISIFMVISSLAIVFGVYNLIKIRKNSKK